MNRIIAFLLFLFVTLLLSAQEKQYLFKNFNKTNGLSHNQIQSILKDKKGFIWIGTVEGLCRFDGYTFKVFKNDPRNSKSLIDNNVSNLFEDPKGNIWFAAGDYFEILDPETEAITHQQTLFNNRINVPIGSRWFQKYDTAGDLWYANNYSGVYKYEVSTDSLIKINFNFNTYDRIITWLETDKKGNAWIALSNSVIYKIDISNLRITDSIQLIKKYDNAYRLFVDNDNDLWIHDKNYSLGAFYFNSKNKKITHFTTTSVIGKLNSDAVTGFTQDDNGLIWISTDHGGINLMDKRDFSVQYLLNNPFNERSICENSITQLYKDYQGFIWAGSFKRGISYYHSRMYNFNMYKVKFDDSKATGYNDIDNFAEDKDGNLWIGTNGGGLVFFNRKTNTFKQYTHDPKDPTSLGADIIIGMYMDKKDRLWIGTYFGGLNLYDGKKFRHFKNNPSDPSTISDDRVWDICEDSNGKLWVTTLLGGVNVFDPEKMKVIEHFQGKNSSIRSNVVFSVMESKDKFIWFATVDGLRSYDPITKKFEYFVHDDKNPNSLSKNYVFDVYEDSRGLIWAATSDGLNMYNRTTKTFTIFKQQQGLPSNYILTIEEDNNNNLWFSTTNGLSNLIISKDKSSHKYVFTFKNYDINDGLQGNEFNEKAAFKTRNGELLFGGANGFNLFSPEEIKPYNIPNNIVFTDFQIFNKSIPNNTLFNNRVLLKKTITFLPELSLRYKENVFTIEFSSLNFFHPERRQYRYKLENFNDEWFTISSKERKVTYTNLNPGNYIFHLQASNNDGTWDEKEALLTIKVQTPWWNSIFFKIFIFLLSFAILLIFYYLNFYKIKQQKILLEKKVIERTSELTEVNTLLKERQEEITIQNEELAYHRNQLEKIVDERTAALEKALKRSEESDRLKSAFMANMSHEIRTPMNAIVGFSYLLKDDTLSKDEKTEYVDVINKNCESLLVLINDILDISKIESNQIDLIKKPFDVIPLLEELENYYNLQRKQELEIKFIRNNAMPELTLNSDTVRLRQVFQNLLDNAVKFTEIGHIHFGYEIQSNKVKFFVADTGIGIKETDFQHIFNSFNKIEANSAKLYRGAGLGLSISKKIIELLEGDIWVNSKPGIGTSFFFTVPYNPEISINNKKTKSEIITPSLETEIEILVAEDEPANYRLIERILKTSKAKVKWAKNGVEAVDYVKNNSTHNLLILMDIKMPIMNGIDAYKKIKLINPQIPVIAVTAYAFEHEKEEIMNNDFADYLAKPINSLKLVELIEKNIGKTIH